MKTMTAAHPDTAAAPTTPDFRRRRATALGAALTTVGLLLGAVQFVSGSTSMNGLFFAVLFSLAAGLWVLFSVVMDAREEDVR
ncbi:hypothetical protein [Leifsonia sp. Leaf264]|uniref:hypothetical protein n=1 Tax=Leifsonia sp. Leaf264 TaxID=1736314 RepID=UPI0006F56193|nr:hypothetical protein [Leifsonia sp. Leaf264]KQO98851.1 hypothetical protein ASF30_12375 [Leifsonia sp. Leaf264]